MKPKLILVAANKNGNRIFAKLLINNKNIIKGYYDFKLEKFFITKYIKHNFPKNITKQNAKQILKELLKINHDWKL